MSLKNQIATQLEHLSDREKKMLFFMTFFLFLSIFYAIYHFSIKKKIDLMNKKIDSYEKTFSKIEVSGEEYLRNKKMQKPKTKKPAEMEVQLYSVIGTLATKNGVDIKSINDKPIPQKTADIIEKQVEVSINKIMLDKLAAFFADIENEESVPLYIKNMNVSVEYSNDTLLNAKILVGTFYKKQVETVVDDKKSSIVKEEKK